MLAFLREHEKRQRIIYNLEHPCVFKNEYWRRMGEVFELREPYQTIKKPYQTLSNADMYVDGEHRDLGVRYATKQLFSSRNFFACAYRARHRRAKRGENPVNFNRQIWAARRH